MSVTIHSVRTGFGRYLLRQGITSKDLAARIGYSLPAVKAWRAGQREPQRGALVVLAYELEFVEYEGDEPTVTDIDRGANKVLRLIRQRL